MTKKNVHSANFKARVALAALKENKTLSELSQEFKIHTSLIARWKSQVIQEASVIFEDKTKKKQKSDTDIESLYAQLGKSQSQLEFLKKKSVLKVRQMKSHIDPKHKNLSISEQYRTFGIARSTYYYKAIKTNELTLKIMRRIEEIHYIYPAYGCRKVYVELCKEGFAINQKRVERLWKILIIIIQDRIKHYYMLLLMKSIME